MTSPSVMNMIYSGQAPSGHVGWPYLYGSAWLDRCVTASDAAEGGERIAGAAAGAEGSTGAGLKSARGSI